MTAANDLRERVSAIKDRFQRDADRYSDQTNIASAIGDVGTMDEVLALLDRMQGGEGALTVPEIEEWRRKIKNKIFNEFIDDEDQSHSKRVQAGFDSLCDMALRSLAAPAVPSEGNGDCDICGHEDGGHYQTCSTAVPSATGDMVMVPREPTEAMVEAALQHSNEWTKTLRPMQPLNRGAWTEACIGRYRAMLAAAPSAPVQEAVAEVVLNVKHPDCHKAADAFWTYWRENGETHKHGYYESTWGAINRALWTVGVVPRPNAAQLARVEVERTPEEIAEAESLRRNGERWDNAPGGKPLYWSHDKREWVHLPVALSGDSHTQEG